VGCIRQPESPRNGVGGWVVYGSPRTHVIKLTQGSRRRSLMRRSLMTASHPAMVEFRVSWILSSIAHKRCKISALSIPVKRTGSGDPPRARIHLTLGSTKRGSTSAPLNMSMRARGVFKKGKGKGGHVLRGRRTCAASPTGVICP